MTSLNEQQLPIEDDDDYDKKMFEEYKRLGGKKNKKKYFKLTQIFQVHTYNAYFGERLDDGEQPVMIDERWLYDSRSASIRGFMKEAKIRSKEATLIFNSIDNIIAYT
jgi:hypothetical protein